MVNNREAHFVLTEMLVMDVRQPEWKLQLLITEEEDENKEILNIET